MENEVNGPCCAHLRVSWRTEEVPEGGVRGWWECGACHSIFLPKSVMDYEVSRLTAELSEWTETGHDATTQQSVILMSEVDRLRSAVEWIINDATYKAPEQIGWVAQRWLSRLTDALARPADSAEPEQEK